MKVDKWRNKRLESIRVHHVNEKGELGKLNIEDEHKLIMDETSKLDKQHRRQIKACRPLNKRKPSDKRRRKGEYSSNSRS